MIHRRPGVKLAWVAPEGEEIVDLVAMGGRIFIATRDGVYCFRGPGIRALAARIAGWFKQ